MEREMKDSKIPWIGKIPKEWSVIQLSSIFKEHKDKNRSLEENNLLSLSYGKIIRKDINTKEGLLPKSFDGYNIIKKGDIVFRLTDLQNDKRSLRTALCKEKGIITSAYITIRRTQELYPEYFHFLLHSYDECKVFYGLGDGVRQGMTFDDLKKLLLVVPPTNKQIKIVSFLEDKCADIDNLIILQEQMIGELKAYKQSVITEAVCKGLDKSVPMKDSGIEWIGEIPVNWEIRKVSHIYNNIGSGTTPKSSNENYYVENGFNFLQTGDLNDSFITTTSKQLSEIAMEECTIKIYPKGSLVVALYGATIGKLGILKIETATNQACCVLGGHSIYDSKFGFYMFYAYRPYLLNLANGGGQPNISQEIIKSSKLLCPPLVEQKAIVLYLDNKCFQIDNLISIKQQKIEELKEYKKSMIYEYITGKKEVAI